MMGSLGDGWEPGDEMMDLNGPPHEEEEEHSRESWWLGRTKVTLRLVTHPSMKILDSDMVD
jgi:hypothetical protein